MALGPQSVRVVVIWIAFATNTYASLTLSSRDGALPDPSALVNLTTFPECATADCVASQSFLTSRLGCQSSELTVGCLCDEALAPLDCVPTGPSDEDSCWSESENWMLGVCGKANLVNKDTMPNCIVECVATYLVDSGCGPSNGTVSRNCFCKLAELDAKLDKPKLPSTINGCKKGGCWKNMKPDFEYEEWKDGICIHGLAEKYDQNAYNKHVKSIKQARIAAAVVIPIFSAIVGGISGALAHGDGGVFFAVWIILTGVLYIAILPPLYLAL